MKTIIGLFENSVKNFGDNVLLLEKVNGAFKPSTYKDIQAEVEKFASGLLSLGINKGDRVALLAEGCNNWIISELGIFYVGGVNVPMSVKLTESDELMFRVSHSNARYLIVSKNQYLKVEPLMDQLPELEKVIVFGDSCSNHPKCIPFNEVMQKGLTFLSANRDGFEARRDSVQASDYATISYTSGTTADPKGIILSHRNYTANVEQSLSLFEVPSYFTTLLILPWDHAFAHTVGIYPLMRNGGSIASIQVGNTPLETLKNIPINIKEIKPHFILSVPALAKNFKKNIEKGVRDKGKIAERLFNQGVKIGTIYNGLGFDRGKGARALLKPLYRFYDKILFSKIRENFGGRLKFFVGGGALLDINLQKFFYAIGIPMYQGYGLSEAAPVISSNNPNLHKMGSSGVLVENQELKICDEDGNELPVGQKGEIVVKGENVMMGYWRNESATSETLRNGWLHTGDMGYMDEDGFLYVLGRFKSLLIADDGEKFSPEAIEEAFVEHSPYIEQCMLYNNQNPYTVGLFVLNKESIKRYIATNMQNGETKEELVIKLVEDELKHYHKGGKYESMFPHRWLPTGIAILDEGFTEENRLVNSTLKIVRPKITEKYQERIDFMYTIEGKKINNDRNIDALNALLE